MYNSELTCYSCNKPFDYGEKMYCCPKNTHTFCYSCLKRAQEGVQDMTVDEFATLLTMDLEVNK